MRCPYCTKDDSWKHSKTPKGDTRYICRKCGKTFTKWTERWLDGKATQKMKGDEQKKDVFSVGHRCLLCGLLIKPEYDVCPDHDEPKVQYQEAGEYNKFWFAAVQTNYGSEPEPEVE